MKRNMTAIQICGILLGEQANRRNLFFSIKTLGMAAQWLPTKKENLMAVALDADRSVGTVRRRIRRWRKELAKLESENEN